jgi:hypothetical protein
MGFVGFMIRSFGQTNPSAGITSVSGDLLCSVYSHRMPGDITRNSADKSRHSRRFAAEMGGGVCMVLHV